MGELKQAMPVMDAPEEAAVPKERERRREPRNGVPRPVYLRPVDRDSKRFEEVRTMNNFSRSGFYFITHEGSYRPGMNLYVIPAFGSFNFEYEAEVVRVEELPFEEFGIAVQLKRIGKLIVKPESADGSAFRPVTLVERPESALARANSES